MPFEFHRLAIPGVILVRAPVLEDERGFFVESYKHSVFAENGIAESFVQDNYSRSRHGVLRGLHYQKRPKAQGKLVTVMRGEIFDVAADLRHGSPTYGRWVSAVLSSREPGLFYIPPGFAHGFCVLSPEADVVYKVTAEYAPDLDRGVAWNDPELAITWPITNPILSPRDAALPQLQAADNNFHFEATP